jgi:hypothetical protein
MNWRQFSAFPRSVRTRSEEVHPSEKRPRAFKPLMLKLAAFSTCGYLLAACSPALNWRKVEIQELRAQLPCKPDQATRKVDLGGQSVNLEMAGCEADGALFAVSRIEANDPASAAKAMDAWKQQTLSAMRATRDERSALQPPVWADAHTSIVAQGSNAHGQPVQATLTWVLRQSRVYHFAVYAEHLSDRMIQPLLEDVQAP